MGDALTPAERQARYRATPNGRAVKARHNAKYNKRRVLVGQWYVGLAPSPEIATQLNDETKERFNDRKH